jgi:hypothetical protein
MQGDYIIGAGNQSLIGADFDEVLTVRFAKMSVTASHCPNQKHTRMQKDLHHMFPPLMIEKN